MKPLPSSALLNALQVVIWYYSRLPFERSPNFTTKIGSTKGKYKFQDPKFKEIIGSHLPSFPRVKLEFRSYFSQYIFAAANPMNL